MLEKILRGVYPERQEEILRFAQKAVSQGLRVKLPAHRAGLPGKDNHFDIAPP